ncbi:MAG: hypothetical protein JSU01_03640 [Bacteroidetes bacterium]|nr:hypothetical protein [Bacteroidota bacterium]
MNRDRGNRDWLNEYMSLKQVNPNNPFTVPEGYFDSLDEQILSKIKLEELKTNTTDSGFTVPEGYFDELTGNIRSRIAVEEALDKEATGFSVPDGYFENLEQQIQSRIFVEESLEAQPAGFEVPEGYFDNLTANILAKTAIEQKPQRSAVVRQLFRPVVFKYAAAACLVLAIGGTWFLNQGVNDPEQAHKNSFLHKSLSAIPVADIQNYLESHLDLSDTKTLMDQSKPADADNLSHDLQNALDSTAQ